MAKYLFQASYTAEGLKGLIKEGGTTRAAEASHLSESLGGRVEAHYYALGDHDVYVIADLPDNVSATAASLAVGASGALSVKTVVLLTGAEVDEAAQKTASYRPPGQ
jgi:uncharacterized protein with GYD domain